MAVTDRSAVDPVRTTTIPKKRGAERREDDGLTLAAAKSTLAALTQAEPVPLDAVRHTITEADLIDYEFTILCEEIRGAIAAAVSKEGFTEFQMASELRRIDELQEQFELRGFNVPGREKYFELERIARGIRRARAARHAGGFLATEYLIHGHEADRPAREVARHTEGGT